MCYDRDSEKISSKSKWTSLKIKDRLTNDNNNIVSHKKILIEQRFFFAYDDHVSLVKKIVKRWPTFDLHWTGKLGAVYTILYRICHLYIKRFI